MGYIGLLIMSHTPQQNGLSERRNWHILEIRRALLHYAQLPSKFWSFSLQTAIYLINRMPSSALGRRRPFEVSFQSPPNYMKIRIFG